MAKEASRRFRFFQSLRGRALFFALGPALLGLVACFAVLEILAYRELTRELRLKAVQVADVNSRVLASTIYFLNSESLQGAFRTLLEDADFVAVVVTDKSDSQITAWTLRTADGVHAGKGPLEEGTDFSDAAQVSQPVFYGPPAERQKIADLDLYFTDERLKARLQRRLLVDAGFLVLILGAMAAGVAFAVRRTVTVPVTGVIASLQAGKGEEGYRQVDWRSDDEVGKLVREYNDMLAAEVSARDVRSHRLELYEKALDHVNHGFCAFDRDFRLTAYNRRYQELLDYDEGALELGRSLSGLLKSKAETGEYGTASIDGLIIDRLAIAAGGERYRRERERPDGTTLEIDSNPLPGGGFVSVYTDVTERKEYEKKMRHMTLHDTLTQLPNRGLFYDRLRQALQTAERLDQRLAVLMVDIDGFQLVNETQGREAGDAVLKEVAERLREILRKSDTAARLEADVFAVLQQDLANVDEAAFLGHRVLGGFARPFETREVALRLTASIGMTIYPDDDPSSKDILRHAHLAMHAAKAEGRNRYRYFLPEMDRAVAARRHLEEDLFLAIRDQQFVLHYQPKIDLRTGAVAGAEALVRWQHPERGLLSPAEFIELAEERGLIVPLTEWILEEACRQRQVWQSRGIVDGRVAVNLSPRHFAEGNVVESVTTALEKTALDHHLLEIEVTEKAFLQNPERVATSLRSLRELGVGAAVDDFGTGDSSISSLHQFPIDTIKIDRRFVHGFGEDEESATVVKAVIFLGRKLDLRVVAEGVEDEEQLRLLRDEGCNEVQGNYFSAPMTGEEFLSWVAARPDDSALRIDETGDGEAAG